MGMMHVKKCAYNPSD